MFAFLALSAVQAGGSFQQADLIRRQGDIQSQINDMNAQFADLDAYNAVANGQANAAKYQGQVDKTIAAGRGAYASEGVTVGYGTAGDMEKSNHIAGLVNSLALQRQARDQAMGYQGQAINMRLGGQMTRIQAGLNADMAGLKGITQAAGTLVSGYQYESSTGKGRDSTTGTNDQAWKSPHEMEMTQDGSGMKAPSKLYQPNPGDSVYKDYGNGFKTYDDGFFGQSPRGYSDQMGRWIPSSGNGNYSFSSSYSNNSVSEMGG